MKIALFLFALFTLPAFGADATVESFRSAAREIPEALRAKGYESFGNLRLSEVLARIDAARVRPRGWLDRDERVVPGFATARSGAQWSKEGDVLNVDVNRQLWSRSSRAERSVLALHEHLGGADHNYQVSTALWLLSLPDAERFLRPEEKADFVRRISTASGNGGITGVGGGGDPAGVSARLGLLRRDLAKVGRAEGAARATNLNNMYLDFELAEEVRWRGSMKDVEITVYPAERADAIQLDRSCQALLNGPPKLARDVFAWMQKNNPAGAADLRNPEGLLAFCRQQEAR